jgi:hypothetical protein
MKKWLIAGGALMFFGCGACGGGMFLFGEALLELINTLVAGM